MPDGWPGFLFSCSVRRHAHLWRAVVCLCLALGGALWPISPLAAQSDAFDSSSRSVNVELILDVSGSMAEIVQGTENQTRMDAAKEALLEVIDQIPEQPGLNVGLRVYGHVGSSLQADQAVSCATTELLVPLTGVDRGALVREVQAVQPTGWTPLAQALLNAGADFAPGESVTNAVIMVTDGEETCGGDPCAVAGSLHASGVELTTHVVGFALTGAQQDAVRCIAEQGGGQLFTAADAASLSEAVFTAFSQVEVAPANPGVVVGNAFEFLETGAPGELTAVAAGLENESTMLLVVRNNTTETVENVQANVTAFRGERTGGSGTTMLTAPYVVEPGGVALIQVFFSDGALTVNDTFDVVFTSDAPGTTDPVIRGAALLVDGVTPNELGLDVVQRNPYPFAIGPNQYQYAMCFDATGAPHHYLFDTTVLTEVPVGATAPELIPDYRANECPYYLVTTAGDPIVEIGVAPLVPPVTAPPTTIATSGATTPGPVSTVPVASNVPAVAPVSTAPAPVSTATAPGLTAQAPVTPISTAPAVAPASSVPGSVATIPVAANVSTTPPPVVTVPAGSIVPVAASIQTTPLSTTTASAAPPTANAPAAPSATGASQVPPAGTVSGTAFGVLEAGVPGELAAVASGIDGADTVLLVVKNNTGATVENVQATVSAQIGAQTVIGETVHVAPYEVPAGGVALVEVSVAQGGLTEQTQFTIDISSDTAGTTPPRARLETDLVIEQMSLDQSGATIDVRNPYPVPIGPNQNLYLMCFDATGTPDHLAFDTETASNIPANGAATLQLTDARIGSCAQFLAAVTGEPPR